MKSPKYRIGVGPNLCDVIYSPLLRCSTARGSVTWLYVVGPTEVKARKSVFSLKVPL